MPPNIFFSVRPLRRPRALRIRSANRSSNAMGVLAGRARDGRCAKRDRGPDCTRHIDRRKQQQ